MPNKQVASSNQTAEPLAGDAPAQACATSREERATFTGAGRAAAWLARECVQALGSVELTPSQYRVLTLLAGGQSMASLLAARLAVNPSSVSTLVDGIVARGLVERRHSEDDRRRISLTLTGSGRDLLARADEAIEARLAEIADHLDPAESHRALAGLDLWSDALAARLAAGKGDDALDQQINPSPR